MEIILISFLFFVVCLLLEKSIHTKRIKKIPLRITVTGTRGKTSIVRTLASVFRQNGIQVLAKTTGSEATYILPDGEEETIKRFGKTSILEQKKLIKKAIKLKADCVISEIMSIHPECHFIETHRLIKPEYTILSNVRPDHIHVIGESIQEISSVYIQDIYPGSTIFVHEDEINEELLSGAKKIRSNLVIVKKDSAKDLPLPKLIENQQIAENTDLIYTASKQFGIDDETICKGIENVRLDKGKLELFKITLAAKEVFFVNTFAANDPDSTQRMIKKTINSMDLKSPSILGLLSLRSDRAERSQQWLDYLRWSETSIFNRVFIAGTYARLMSRKITGSVIIRDSDPNHITNEIISNCKNGSIVFGIGNYHGLGGILVDYWSNSGIKMTGLPQ